MNKQKLRGYIRQMLEESVNNFIEKEKETTTKQLKDTSKPEVLGDPLEVELNQLANELGSDGKNAPTVAVKAGGVKGGNDFATGKHKANFSDKTDLAK